MSGDVRRPLRLGQFVPLATAAVEPTSAATMTSAVVPAIEPNASRLRFPRPGFCRRPVGVVLLIGVALLCRRGRAWAGWSRISPQSCWARIPALGFYGQTRPAEPLDGLAGTPV